MGMISASTDRSLPVGTQGTQLGPKLRRQRSLRVAGLRAAMITWGVLSITSGLVSTLFPGAIGALNEASTNTFLLGSWGWLTAVLGFGVLFASIDPVRHILWIRVALLSFVVGGGYSLVHVVAGTVTLGAITVDLIAYAIFGLLFLALYPRSPRMVNLGVATRRGELHTDADEGGLFLREVETGGFIRFDPRSESALVQASTQSHSQANGTDGHSRSADRSNEAPGERLDWPRISARQPLPPTFRPATFTPPPRQFTWHQPPSPESASRESEE